MNIKSINSLTLLAFWASSALAMCPTTQRTLSRLPRIATQRATGVQARRFTTLPAVRTAPTDAERFKAYQAEDERKKQEARRFLQWRKKAEEDIAFREKVWEPAFEKVRAEEAAEKAATEQAAAERLAGWREWQQYTGDMASKAQKSRKKTLSDVSTEAAEQEKLITGYKRRKARENLQSQLRDYVTALGLGALISYLYGNAQEEPAESE